MLEGLLSPMHLIIILAIGLLVLGPKRLPEAGRGIGSAMREFKNSIGGGGDEATTSKAVAAPAIAPVGVAPVAAPVVKEPTTAE